MKNKVRDVILRRSTFIIALLLILSAFALLRIVSTHRDINDVASIDIPLIELLTQIETKQLEQSISFERALRYAQEMGNNDLTALNFQKEDSNFHYLAKIVDQDLKQAEIRIKEALTQTEQEAQQIKLKGLLLSIQKLESDHSSYEKHVFEVLELLENGHVSRALLISEKVEAEEDQFNKQVEGVLMRHEMFTEALVNVVEQEEVLSMKWIVMLTLAFVILSLVAVYTFSYKIWRPMEDIRSGAEKLGAGHLNTRIKLRSSGITEDIVEAFNGMAEKLQESQAEIERYIHFSYSTAHDLKTPINNMKSLLDMLARPGIGESDFETILRNTKRAVSQLGVTVDALNEVNHLREKLNENKERLSFDRILKEVGAGMLDQIKESKAVIKKDFSKCPHIDYPKHHLKSIMQNLLTNAIKYRNPEKNPAIQIRTSVYKGQTILIVKDNGLGFDSIKYKEEMMKPFVRLHSHTEGSGLGMYIIKTILDYHEGEIKVESKPKQGAQFTIFLNGIS